MGTYKVIQDIEAEDHILGPLSLRQFIYAIIAVLCFYLSFVVYKKGAAFLMVLFIPPGLFCAFFAAPFGKDQPTEVWALAKIRFYFKPRRRIWDQSGMKDLVAITVPKKIEVRRTDGLSQTEVRSRLNALASTIDSRGWVVKGADVNLYSRPGIMPADSDSDRLVGMGSMPQQVSDAGVSASDDILDAQSNPIAQQFDQMITASTQAHHQQIVDMLQHDNATGPMLPAPVATAGAAPSTTSNWFLDQTSPVVPSNAQAATAANSDDQTASTQLRANSHAKDATYGHMKTIQPLGQQTQSASVPPPTPAPQPVPQPTPKAPDPTTAQLAANNDLNIATLARVASKKDLPTDDEVIIPLH